MISYDNFKRDCGWKYKTEAKLNAAYERRLKISQGGQLTEDEFIIECGGNYDAEKLRAVYARLIELIGEGKLGPSDTLAYAAYGWCLRNPEAIVAYERAQGIWEVNNCYTEISEDKAIIEVNGEWGFEASRVKIIGTPYYDATDYQFIRFDCAHMTWLWKNGSLYQVYE